MLPLTHEQIRIAIGRRSGLPVIVAVHSTRLGQAIGGCRLAHYRRWPDALEDAVRLSAAMTDKCAVAGLANGGGKTVVAMPEAPGVQLRRDALLDVGDAIAAFGGAYATGPDVGTSPTDMVTIGEVTPHVFCRPIENGGSGDSSSHTADGVRAALRALGTHRYGTPGATGRRIAIVGVGRVGEHLARDLAAEGADLILADIDDTKRTIATDIGAAWLRPADALRARVDVLVPAALGGMVTADVVDELRCDAICGPANNQLDAATTVERLRDRGIVWIPDHVAGAGGVIYATAVELHREAADRATERVAEIRTTVATLLAEAARSGRTPAAVADDIARTRLLRSPCRRP